MASQPTPIPSGSEAGSTTTTPTTTGVKERRRSSFEAAFSLFSRKSKTFPLLQQAEPPAPITPEPSAGKPSTAPAPSSLPPLPQALTPTTTSETPQGPPSASTTNTGDGSSPAQEKRRSSLPKAFIDAVGRAASDSLLLVATVAAPRRRSSLATSSRVIPDPALPTLMESQFSDVSSPPPSLPTTPVHKTNKEEEKPTMPTAAGAGDGTGTHITGLRTSSESMDDILHRQGATPSTGPTTAATGPSSSSSSSSLGGSLRRMSLRGQQMIHSLVANGPPEMEAGYKPRPASEAEAYETSPADLKPSSRPSSADLTSSSRMASKMSMRTSFRAIRSGIFGNRGSSSGLEDHPPDQPPPYMGGATISDLRKYILLRKSFLKYCDVYHPCQEKVLFLVALDEFLALQEDDMVGQAAKMKAIDTEFIVEGSKHDIGLGRVIRNTISKKAERYLQQSSQFWGNNPQRDGVVHGKQDKEAGGDFDKLSKIVSDDESSDDSDEEEEEEVTVATLPTVTRKEVYALAEKEVEEYLSEFVLGPYLASEVWTRHIEPWLKATDDLSKASEGERDR